MSSPRASARKSRLQQQRPAPSHRLSDAERDAPPRPQPLSDAAREVLDGLLTEQDRQRIARWQTEAPAALDGLRLAFAFVALSKAPYHLDRPAARQHLAAVLNINGPEMEDLIAHGTNVRQGLGLR
jgi:hypothetical protein